MIILREKAYAKKINLGVDLEKPVMTEEEFNRSWKELSPVDRALYLKYLELQDKYEESKEKHDRALRKKEEPIRKSIGKGIKHGAILGGSSGYFLSNDKNPYSAPLLGASLGGTLFGAASNKNREENDRIEDENYKIRKEMGNKELATKKLRKDIEEAAKKVKEGKMNVQEFEKEYNKKRLKYLELYGLLDEEETETPEEIRDRSKKENKKEALALTLGGTIGGAATMGAIGKIHDGGKHEFVSPEQREEALQSLGLGAAIGGAAGGLLGASKKAIDRHIIEPKARRKKEHDKELYETAKKVVENRGIIKKLYTDD